MTLLFYASAVVAVAATLLAVTRANAVHALLYLIVSLLGAATAMLALGAPFVAALEVLVYAGAIMVLFVFVVMLLNLPGGPQRELAWRAPRTWAGPALLAGGLLVELLWAFAAPSTPAAGTAEVGVAAVGATLYGPYLVAVELASMLLLAGLVAAYHLGRRDGAKEGS
jgi:NADH-quinone oxidoreductase subunit J